MCLKCGDRQHIRVVQNNFELKKKNMKKKLSFCPNELLSLVYIAKVQTECWTEFIL